MNDDRRALLDQLGRSFERIRTAHFSIRANVRDAQRSHWEANIRQWADAVERYTRALEQLSRQPSEPPPPTAEAAIERVKARVLGRIVSGKFVWEEE